MLDIKRIQEEDARRHRIALGLEEPDKSVDEDNPPDLTQNEREAIQTRIRGETGFEDEFGIAENKNVIHRGLGYADE